jgi:hypothetical protein
MEHTTPLPILARLIAKFQDEAENFSCGVGAGGYKSEDNPFGQDPAEEAYLQNEIKILTTEWQERTGNKWTENDRRMADFQLTTQRRNNGQPTIGFARDAYGIQEQDYSDWVQDTFPQNSWEHSIQEDLDQDHWEDAGFYEE